MNIDSSEERNETVMKRTHSFLIRIALISTILLLIPFTVMSVVFYDTINSVLLDEILRKAQVSADRTQQAIVAQVQNIDRFQIQASETREFQSHTLSKNGGAFLEIRRQLTNYSLVNDFISDVGMINFSTDRVYTAQGVYTLDYFFREILRSDTLANNYLEDTLSSISKRIWLPQDMISSYDRSRFAIIYAMPQEMRWINGNPNVYSISYFLIDCAAIQEVLDSFAFSEDTKTVLWIDNQPVFYSDEGLLATARQETTSRGWRIVEVAERRYYTMPSKVDASYDILLESFIPVDSTHEKAAQILKKALIAIILTLIVEVLLLILIVRYNYAPIRRFVSQTKLYSANLPEQSNEVKAVEFAIDALFRDKEIIEGDIRNLLEEKYLLRLIGERVEEKGPFLEAAKLDGIDFTARYYICCIINLQNAEGVSRTDFAKQALSQGTEYHLVEYIAHRTYVCAIGAASREKLSSEKHMFEADCSQLPAHVYWGSEVQNVFDLYDSYREARRQTFETGLSGHILRASDVRMTVVEEIREDLIAFYQAIRDVNSIRMKVAVNNLCNVVRETDPVKAHSITSGIVLTAEQALDTDTKGHQGSVLGIHMADLFGKTSEEYAQIVSRMGQRIEHELCRLQPATEDNRARKEIGKINEYIQNNYHDPNFSIKTMAQSMNISSSNLSHYYKSRTGENLSDFINNLRIDEAKLLLPL